ncbi:MAG: hypothetical protein ACREC5_08330, partial [Thermoplasmata archaeon]
IEVAELPPVPVPAGVPVAPVESTEIVPVMSVFAPAAYRGFFLDLTEREFEALPGATESARSSTELPPGPSERPAPKLRGPSLSQRVVLHLGHQPRLSPQDIATTAYTQAGMGELLEAPQSALSNVLRRLQFSGILRLDVDHVQGAARRLNVYRLTPKGELLAERLRRHALVPVEPTGMVRSTKPVDPSGDGGPEN